jgi:serine/threonine protein kinase
MLQALTYLHLRGICHADFYAHNILFRREPRLIKLTDFGSFSSPILGAAFFYDTSTDYGRSIQVCELRAFSTLILELTELTPRSSSVTIRPVTSLLGLAELALSAKSFSSLGLSDKPAATG